MDKWEKRILNEMDLSLKGTKEKDLRFFRIDELQRNIARIGEFSSACNGCKLLKIDIETALVHMNEAVNVPGPHRRDLDRLTVRIGRHMMKNHHIYPPWHFNYLYSFYGIVAGSLIGLMLVFLFPGETWEFLAAGFVAGLIAGQLAGGKRDREIRNSNRLM